MRRAKWDLVLAGFLQVGVCLVMADVFPVRADINAGFIPKQEIESFHVYTDIRYRFATTKMHSLVRNTAGVAHEMAFDVTLPKEAFIVSFAMTIDGKVYDGEVKEKSQAKDQYSRAVQAGQSAGHIRQTPRHSNRFDVSVNVANGTAVNFSLTYQEILPRKLGLYEYEMHVEPGQAVKDFNVQVFIQENTPLSFIKTPKLRKASTMTNAIEADNDLTTVDRPTKTTAHIKYSPTFRQQGAGGLSARFVVQYDVEHSDNGQVLVADGYFIHMFSPKPQNPLPKDIIFVLDLSGSMSGIKLAQLKSAMHAILEDLSDEDRFNILTFSGAVSRWKPALTTATTQVFQEAQQFVDDMVADGGTNINLALVTAVEDLLGREVESRVGMVFFLTDGAATVGETVPAKIATNVKSANVKQTSIFALAFGQGANLESLKTISTQNFGYARKIYEASDAALQVASLYDEISTVAMKDVTVKYLPTVTKTTETEFPVVLNGTEIFIGGCIDLRQPILPWPGSNRPPIFHAQIEGKMRKGPVDIVLEVDDLREVTIHTDESLNSFFTMPRDYSGIIEKMWAFLTIQQMLKERQVVVEEKDLVDELNKNILEMSLKYKFVTPLTSMVVTKPDSKEPVRSSLQDADKQSDHVATRQHSSGMMGLPGLSRGGNHRMMTKHKSVSRSYNFPSGDLSPHKPARKTRPIVPIALPKKPTKVGRKNSRVRKPRRKKALMSVLRSIVLRTDQKSLCLAPKKTPSGRYLLVDTTRQTGASATGFKAELVTSCAKNCRLVVPSLLYLITNSSTSQIGLSPTGHQYQSHPDFDVSLVGINQMVLKHKDATITITRHRKARKVNFSIEVLLVSGANFPRSAAMTDLLREKIKVRPKVPAVCVKAKADAWVPLVPRRVKKYQV